MAIRLTARSLFSEPSRSTTRAVGKTKPRRAADLDGDQVAVFGLGCRAGRNGDLLAEHFLVHRLEAPAAVRQLVKNSKHASFGMIDDLDDAAAVADAVVGFRFVDAQQHAIAEAGGFARPCLARDRNADFRGGPMRLFVPFVGRGDEVAVAVAGGDVGEHGGGQGAGVVQLLVALLDRAFVGRGRATGA